MSIPRYVDQKETLQLQLGPSSSLNTCSQQSAPEKSPPNKTIKSPPSFDSVNKEPDYLNACEIDQFSTDDVNNKTQFPKDYISTTNKDPFKIKNNNIYDHEDSPHDSVVQCQDVCQLNNCKDDVIICKDSDVIIICNSILRK